MKINRDMSQLQKKCYKVKRGKPSYLEKYFRHLFKFYKPLLINAVCTRAKHFP
jgi:hypothetical protein